MKKIKQFLFTYISPFTWEILQTLLGLFVLLILKGKQIEGFYKRRLVIRFKKGKFFSGTSLGFFILLPYESKEKVVAHEFGHCRQSARRGPAYLFWDGIPSLRNNLEARKRNWTYDNYYNLRPEWEADELGGIVLKNGVRVYDEMLSVKDFIGFPKDLNKKCSKEEFHKMMAFNDSEIPIEEVHFLDYPDTRVEL